MFSSALILFIIPLSTSFRISKKFSGFQVDIRKFFQNSALQRDWCYFSSPIIFIEFSIIETFPPR